MRAETFFLSSGYSIIDGVHVALSADAPGPLFGRWQVALDNGDAALASASTAFDLMQRKYENGKATATDFQDAKTRYLRAESQQIQARYTYLFRQKILDFYRGRPL